MTIQGLNKVSMDTADNIAFTSTSDKFGVGAMFVDSGTGAIVQWVKNAESATATAIGDALVQCAAGTAYSVELSGATAALPLLGFAAAVIAAGSYGFMTVYGPGYALVDGDTDDVAIGNALESLGAKSIGLGDEQTRAIAMQANAGAAAVLKVYVKGCLGSY